MEITNTTKIYADHGCWHWVYDNLGDALQNIKAHPDRSTPCLYVAIEKRPEIIIDMYEFVQSALHECFDGKLDFLQGVNELKAAFKAFEEANKDYVVYTPDYSQRIGIKEVTEYEARYRQA